MSHFPIVDVSAWEVVNPETIGRDARIWLRPPDAPPDSREHDWLFKPVVVPAHGQAQGEDWAEKIVGPGSYIRSRTTGRQPKEAAS